MQVRERMRRGYSTVEFFWKAMKSFRHCKGQGPEAIQSVIRFALDCFAALAMTQRAEVSRYKASIRPIVS
jgi:hypothetical protein